MFQALLEAKTSTIGKDLKLNFNRLLSEGALSKEEALLVALASAKSLEFVPLIEYATEGLKTLGVPEDQIQEAQESAAIMNMLNTYYKFKHMVAKDDDYRTAGLRMTALARPVLGKEKFEMLSLAVSIINGCESCIKAHENVLRASKTPEQIHDIARLASVIKGIKGLH